MPSRTLSAAVRASVSSTVRSRGESYFSQRRVSILLFEGHSLVASVRGTQTYQVTLDLQEKKLTVSCTCPYFTDNITPCKHVWATILAADEARAFNVPPGMWLSVSEEDEIDDLDELEDLDPLDDLADEADFDDDLGAGRYRKKMSAAQRQGVTERMKRYWAERRRAVTHGSRTPARPTPRPAPPPPPPAWQSFLAGVAQTQADFMHLRRCQ